MKKPTRREKMILGAAIAVVVGYVMLQFVIDPYLKKRDRIDRMLAAKTQELEQMRLMKAEYDGMNSRAAMAQKRFSKRSRNFDLFKFMNDMANKAGIKDNVAYMKPSKSNVKDSPYKLAQVEMKIQGVNLKQLTPYLHLVETSPNSVHLKRMSVTKKGRQKGVVDAVLQVETYEM